MSQPPSTHRIPWRTHHSHPAQPEVPPTAHAAEESAVPLAGHLFKGMRHDPARAMPDYAQRAFDPTVAPWSDQEPGGYLDGLNVYNAPVDEPVNRINPLGM